MCYLLGATGYYPTRTYKIDAGRYTIDEIIRLDLEKHGVVTIGFGYDVDTSWA